MKADFARLQDKIDHLTGQPGWRTNKVTAAKAQKFFVLADLYKRRLRESKEWIIKEEENLIGTKNLLNRMKERLQIYAGWQSLYKNYKPDAGKHGRRIKRVEMLEKVLKGKTPRKAITGRLNRLKKQRKKMFQEVKAFKDRFNATLLPWRRKFLKAEKEEAELKQSLAAAQEKRKKKKGQKNKTRTDEELVLRKQLKLCMETKILLQSTVDKATGMAMPLAYKSCLKEMLELENFTKLNMIPVDLQIRKAQQEWKDLCDYRARKMLKYEKKTLEKLFEKRVQLFADNKQTPGMPKTAPIAFRPSKSTLFPDTTCIEVSWKAIPEKNISGYTIAAFALAEDGKFLPVLNVFKSSNSLILDKSRGKHYVAVIEGLNRTLNTNSAHVVTTMLAKGLLDQPQIPTRLE